ncbi:MAG: FliH/SctL family protein [bacterium]
MIIKKGKKDDNNQKAELNKTEQNSAKKQGDSFFIQEEQERRRDDRRRGYRRLDDRNIISRAHEEANLIKENAAREGFEYGLSLSKEELKKLSVVITDFIKAKEDSIKKASPDIAFLAIKVAEKIIQTKVATDETIVLNIVSNVLKEIGKDETNIVIKVNSSDVQLVKENLSNIFPYGGINTKITVIENNEVEWGSCIVETNNGMVDARFSTQLQILKKAFETAL